jgi:DNA repair protein RadC
MSEEKDLNEGHRDRLRDRFFEAGLDAFEPHEVIELLLFYVYPRVDTKKKAKKALEHFHNDFHSLLYASKEELNKAGLSDNSASLIKLAREIFIYQLKKDLADRREILSSQEAYEYLRAYFKGVPQEELCVIYLDNRNKVISISSEFQGTFNETKIYIRELVKQCLKHNASIIILAHNHPSGSLEPSATDINITNKIRMALEVFDIKILDHILVGDNNFYSFVEYGLL